MRFNRWVKALCAGVSVFVLVIHAAGAGAHDQPDRSDPGKAGPYAVGHLSYSFVDRNNGNRPVLVSVWYPVDPATITSSTPSAIYPLDPYTGTTNVPATHSTDWEALGYDAAFEGPAASTHGPFPLVVFSSGWVDNSWFHVFHGARLASHGFVFAAIDHYAECQWPWSACDDLMTSTANRPRDVSFVITQMLQKSRSPGQSLFRAIDPDRISAAGHSLGGYAAFALAGGDDAVCDALWPVVFGYESLPYPPSDCVRIHPDERVKAIISLDGTAELMRWEWLSRISMPSLIMGQTVENEAEGGGLGDEVARPHAAIAGAYSYRVDVEGASHYSFTNYCDVGRIPSISSQLLQALYTGGWIPAPTVESFYSTWPCASTGVQAATISPLEANRVVTKYMTAFLNVHLGAPGIASAQDWSVLTPEYALDHTPSVEFFNSEHCRATLPDRSQFSYRPHQTSSECDSASKDPAGYFSPLSGWRAP